MNVMKKNTKRLGMVISTQVHEKLMVLAEKEDRSLCQIIRIILNKYCEDAGVKSEDKNDI